MSTRRIYVFAQCASLLTKGIRSSIFILFLRKFHCIWTLCSSLRWQRNWSSANFNLFHLKCIWSVECLVSNYKPSSSHLITLLDSISVSFNPVVVKWFSKGCICFLLLPDNFLMSPNSLCESKVISSNG